MAQLHEGSQRDGLEGARGRSILLLVIGCCWSDSKLMSVSKDVQFLAEKLGACVSAKFGKVVFQIVSKERWVISNEVLQCLYEGCCTLVVSTNEDRVLGEVTRDAKVIPIERLGSETELVGIAFDIRKVDPQKGRICLRHLRESMA